MIGGTSLNVDISTDVVFCDRSIGVIVAILETTCRISAVSDQRRLLVVTPEGIEVSEQI